MSACEKCWTDAGGIAARYSALVEKRNCTPEEQAGPEPEWAQDGCFGCPVAHAVNDQGCSKTPYSRWSEYQSSNRNYNGPGRRVFNESSKELAQSELDFLRSLVPQPTASAP